MKEKNALKKIKSTITSTPCLVLIDYINKSKELFLYIDALSVALGGGLTVKNAEGQQTLVFYSQRFNSAKANHTIVI